MGHVSPGGEPVSFGTVRFRNRVVPGLLVTAASFPTAGGLPPHFHARTVVATTYRGAFGSRIRGREYWLPTSTTVIEPIGERHANQFSRLGANVLVLQPDPTHENVVGPLARALAEPQRVSHYTLAPLASRLAQELDADDDLASLTLQALGIELLTTAGRLIYAMHERRPPWLSRVRERLHDSASTPPLDELAALADVHVGHLTRAFRQAFGCSIGHYARALRLTRAAERLRDADVPLAVVAAEAGFADQSHFTRLFRRHLGCTPHVYRASHAGRAVRSKTRAPF